MNGLLTELGKKLPERWVELLLLPGALWVTVLLAGSKLGHTHAWDVRLLRSWANDVAGQPQSRSAVMVGTAVAALLVTAAVSGLLATALGAGAENLHALRGNQGLPRLLRAYRQWRWRTATAKLRRAVATRNTPNISRIAAARAGRRIRSSQATRRRLGGRAPACPTWVSDNFAATHAHLDRRYSIDVDTIWPRLWAVLPESVRIDLATARDAYSAACRLIGWGAMYLAVALIWWPAAVVGAIVIATGQLRVRATTVVLGDLTVSAVDLHIVDLAERIGIPANRPAPRDIGVQIMDALT
ncbi:hypothetical protein AB0M22_34570 [Nocardia sp. NPDC051756]|uniref:hypothetical protein n=1 Tax=Nocardia sp. NPDC051756 TaxID=3154751 RepID=UPI00342A4F74